ncbi:hemerythrin family protein [Caldichromatium japonicum]|uniref:Hemerythrin family protein n=1 Tax=Caldichromatium japonicum TaxID=2699430 RepID=A0A6G7V9V7_9GAMM|nr:hemerythrin domain-containing protein [Caldichromatium japonicum]QIK36853.1 hemerythrin family protein [Caldichromatium japonicum]
MCFLSRINQLAAAQLIGNRSIIGEVLDELLDYAQGHFQHEEEFMRRTGFVAYERHYGIHQRFEGWLSQVHWQYLKGLRQDLSEELLKYLNGWLITHILDEDLACRLEGART